MFEYPRGLASQAGGPDPDLLARQLGLLMEGAVIHMEVFRDPQVARTADDAAERLVEAALHPAR